MLVFLENDEKQLRVPAKTERKRKTPEGGPRSGAFAGMRVTGEECPAGLGDKLCPRRMWGACRFPLKFAPRRAPECAGMRRNAPECAGMRRNAARTHGARVHVAEHAQNPQAGRRVTCGARAAARFPRPNLRKAQNEPRATIS